MLRFLWPVAVFALSVYAVVGCIQTKDADVRGLPKLLWLVLILLFPLVGPIAWLIAGRATATSGGPGRPIPPSARPRGPDDDPEFLRRL